MKLTYGLFDNRRAGLPGYGSRPQRNSLASRLEARAAGQNRPLYHSRGLHLRLPLEGRRIVYPYIRKNGSSAFKQWLTDTLAPAANGEPVIKAIAREYLVGFEWELAKSERLLVLRDPVERVGSLFRNKLVQRSGANDILRNIQERSDLDPEKMSFRDFVKHYLGELGRDTPSPIDPHCRTQSSHLWPIRYDRVILLDRLSEAALELFGEEIASRYFARPTNRSSGDLDDRPATDRSCAELTQEFRRNGVLPSDSALMDEETLDVIRSVYGADYALISQSFGR